MRSERVQNVVLLVYARSPLVYYAFIFDLHSFATQLLLACHAFTVRLPHIYCSFIARLDFAYTHSSNSRAIVFITSPSLTLGAHTPDGCIRHVCLCVHPQELIWGLALVDVYSNTDATLGIRHLCVRYIIRALYV